MLLDPLHFAPIFIPLAGSTAGYVRLPGNPGDGMIELATFQLARRFGVRLVPAIVELARREVRTSERCDLLLLAGGGSMGDATPYRHNYEIRDLVRQLSLDSIVLPQSFVGPESGSETHARVYVREAASLEHCPHGILAPDLALGYTPSNDPRRAPPKADCLVACRDGIEGLFATDDVRDPVRGYPMLGQADTQLIVDDYLRAAAAHERLVTDRLHFAIAGLIGGRHVTLLPNNYHKNRSMHETWLRHLGCHWADAPRQATNDIRATV
ncbi:Polysaccharide pyruvyl transferase [Planctomycetes bacterium Pan216]|uniref:Polysaccharide pyruvyl transferase n=1 Tax=Kolteria novifilia TaxID=2527975 RepID=A0A518B214_9BACT|nr:Polysaccharide pyruvyl transferase [Planctomycetes bacterium Pan216]